MAAQLNCRKRQEQGTQSALVKAVQLLLLQWRSQSGTLVLGLQLKSPFPAPISGAGIA